MNIVPSSARIFHKDGRIRCQEEALRTSGRICSAVCWGINVIASSSDTTSSISTSAGATTLGNDGNGAFGHTRLTGFIRGFHHSRVLAGKRCLWVLNTLSVGARGANPLCQIKLGSFIREAILVKECQLLGVKVFNFRGKDACCNIQRASTVIGGRVREAEIFKDTGASRSDAWHWKRAAHSWRCNINLDWNDGTDGAIATCIRRINCDGRFTTLILGEKCFRGCLKVEIRVSRSTQWRIYHTNLRHMNTYLAVISSDDGFFDTVFSLLGSEKPRITTSSKCISNV